MSNVLIFGAGDYARIARIYLEEDSSHDVIGFSVHESYIEENEVDGLPVVPFENIDETHPPDRCSMLVAVGFSKVNQVRAGIYEECKGRGYEFVSYVNSKAIHWGPNEFGENVFVLEANVIQPNVRIGDNTVLWSGSFIGHGATIGDHCFIASHVAVSGNVKIGDYCFVGANATLRDGVTVAPRCVIGAGGLIMNDTDEGGVYAVRGTDPIDRKSWEINL